MADEITRAVELSREIVACSGIRSGSLIYMNIAFHNGDISTVCLDEDGARHLLAALKTLVPDAEAIHASPSIEGTEQPAVQEGYKSS
jgi:hypothetical protein